jgi:DNA ligase-associated metallophosphoesterase
MSANRGYQGLMTLLASPSPRPRPPRRPLLSPAVRLEGDGAAVRFRLQDTLCAALPEGGLWLAEAGALIVSDIHMEKGSAFAARGQLLPPYDTGSALGRLEALAARLRPRMIVSLGDAFHDRRAGERIAPADWARLQNLIAAVDWVWIEGNHDPQPPQGLGGRTATEIKIADLILRHEPRADAAPGEIAGHLHPCARIVGRARSVRARCFATDGARLVMPAFGAYAGGLNVCDVAFAPLFPHGLAALAIARGRVYPAAGESLVGD